MKTVHTSRSKPQQLQNECVYKNKSNNKKIYDKRIFDPNQKHGSEMRHTWPEHTIYKNSDRERIKWKINEIKRNARELLSKNTAIFAKSTTIFEIVPNNKKIPNDILTIVNDIRYRNCNSTMRLDNDMK